MKPLKMLRYVFVVLIIFFNSFYCFIGKGQVTNNQVISSNGGFYQDQEFILSWTTGEIISPPLVMTSNICISGFQQPSFSKLLSVYQNLIQSEITIYPNPVNDVLFIHLNGEKTELNLHIYDLNGKSLFSDKIFHGTTSLNMNGFIPGIYILNFSDKTHFQSFMSIKN